MTNNKIPMTKEIQIPNTEINTLVLKFEICYYFVICALTFVIKI